MADRTIIIAGTGAGGPAVYNLAAAETFRIRSVSWRQTVVAPVSFGEPAIPELLAYDAAGNLIARVLAPAVTEAAPFVPPPPDESLCTLYSPQTYSSDGDPGGLASIPTFWLAVTAISGSPLAELQTSFGPIILFLTSGLVNVTVDVTFGATIGPYSLSLALATIQGDNFLPEGTPLTISGQNISGTFTNVSVAGTSSNFDLQVAVNKTWPPGTLFDGDITYSGGVTITAA